MDFIEDEQDTKILTSIKPKGKNLLNKKHLTKWEMDELFLDEPYGEEED